MSRISVARRLLRRLTFPDAKLINSHYELQPRKSKEKMVGQIVHQVGTELQTLISNKGPFALTRWNEIGVEFGGSPRKSFEAIAEEIERRLDPVYDELEGDMSVTDLRHDKASLRVLAVKLKVNRPDLDALIRDTHGSTLLAAFVTRVRETQNRTTRRAPDTARAVARMRVASTRVSDPSIEKLSHQWMTDFTEGAERIAIAAGFYDVEFVQKLLDKHRSVQDVRLLFNGLGGRRLDAQRKELEELQRKLRRKHRSVDVRLAFAPGMFHSKLFLATEGGSTRGLVGSANATLAAFMRNEEIMVALADAGVLANYFEAAWTKACGLDKLDTNARSLISFFRTGILYFKPVATLTTTLNPFHDLLKLMTNEDRALLGAVRLPHADVDSGIGSFNLKLAVQEDAIGNGAEETTEEMNATDRSKRTKASIVPWSIETCFGYWVPSARDDLWHANLATASKKKRERWTAFRDRLNVVPGRELASKYRDYLLAAKTELEKIEMLPDYLKKLAPHNPFDVSIFSKFLARVTNYLEDKERLERLALPFVSGNIPEIWDDDLAYNDFRTTFFDYLEQVARSGRRNMPAVPNRILAKLNNAVGQSSEQLSDQFEKYLKMSGWTDADWT